MAQDAGFTTGLITQSNLATNKTTVPNLASLTAYYWRVQVVVGTKTSPWSTVWSFTTASPLGVPVMLLPADNASGIPLNGGSAKWSGVTGATIYALQVADNPDFNTPTIDINNLVITSQNLTGLTETTKYYWRVRAGNGTIWGAWSTPRTFTTSAKLVFSPPTLTSPANGATAVAIPPTLMWNVVIGAAQYQAQVATSSDFSTGLITQAPNTGTSVSIPGLSYGTTYYWRVRAGNGTDWSDWSDTWTFDSTPLLGTPTLTDPADATDPVALPPTLKWNAVTDATIYQIQIAQSADYLTSPTTSPDVTGTTYSMPGLAESTQYYWHVRAGNGVMWGPWSDSFSFTSGKTFTAPTLSSPSNGATGVSVTATLKWSSVANATTYEVQVSRTSDFKSPEVDQNDIATNSADMTNLNAKVRYYWRVRAGDGASWSPWSSVRSFTTAEKIDAPTLTTPSAGDTSVVAGFGVEFDWNAVTLSGSATPTYQLQVATNSAFTSGLITKDGLTDTTVTVQLLNNTKYYWRVKAMDGTNSSAWSSTSNFTTTAY